MFVVTRVHQQLIIDEFVTKKDLSRSHKVAEHKEERLDDVEVSIITEDDDSCETICGTACKGWSELSKDVPKLIRDPVSSRFWGLILRHLCDRYCRGHCRQPRDVMGQHCGKRNRKESFVFVLRSLVKEKSNELQNEWMNEWIAQ